MSTALDHAPDAQPWHRQPDETPQAFHAFNVWRDLPPPRTVQEAGRVAAETGKRRPVTVQKQFQEWSRKHNWRERGDAYDLYLDERRLLARETERQRVDRENALEGRYLRQSAITRFTGGKDQHGNDIEAVDWNNVAPEVALTAYRLGVNTERQAVGLMTGQQIGMVSANAARQTIESLFQLALDFIDEDRKAAFIQRARQIAQKG